MKKIYIPKDYDGRVLGLFLSDNIQLVEAFQMGAGITPYTIEEIDIESDLINQTPLVTLLTSYEKRGYNLKDSDSYIFIKRGK
jgi:hypothetical protein